MDEVHKSEESVRAYLLGTLDERDAAELEQNYFENPAYLAWMQTVEDALIGDYLDHELSPAEQRRFEERYLALPDLKNRLNEVIAGRSLRPRKIWWTQTRLVATVAFVLTLAVMASLLVRQRSAEAVPGTVARIEYPAKPAVFEMQLSPGLTKGPRATANEFTIPTGTATVKLTFELPGRSSNQQLAIRFLTIDAEGHRKLAWTATAASEASGNDSKATVELQPTVLVPADYLAEISGREGNVLETYAFRTIP